MRLYPVAAVIHVDDDQLICSLVAEDVLGMAKTGLSLNTRSAEY